jgi:hypothetical protein
MDLFSGRHLNFHLDLDNIKIKFEFFRVSKATVLHNLSNLIAFFLIIGCVVRWHNLSFERMLFITIE